MKKEIMQMTSPLTKVIYSFTTPNSVKIKGLLEDAQVLPEMDFYKFIDLIYQIYGTR